MAETSPALRHAQNPYCFFSLAKKESSAKVRNHLLQFEQCAATWSNAGEAADEKQFVALLKEKVGL